MTWYLVFEEKVPRQNWCLGRIVEILPSGDGQIRGAKILVGKTKAIIDRPTNKLYPIEFTNEHASFNKRSSDNIRVDNTVEVVNHRVDATTNVNDDIAPKIRPKRNAAVIADIKMKDIK